MNNANSPGVKPLDVEAAPPNEVVAPLASNDPARVVEVLRSIVAAQAAVDPGSREGQEALRLWFEARTVLDGCVNRLCNQYYDGRHPKHYLWRVHNEYLIDGVRPGEHVLDIGCGNSAYQQWIAEKASDVLGIDIRPERIDEARRNCTMANVRFELMDITETVPPGPFDVVICSHVLEHLDDPVAVLRRLSGAIPRILVKVPLEDSDWMKLVKRDLGLFWMDDHDHRREYTEAMLREQLESAGWRLTDMVRGADLRATAVSTSTAEHGNTLKASTGRWLEHRRRTGRERRSYLGDSVPSYGGSCQA